MTVIRHTLYMTLRHLRELWRQPWFVAVTLVQPVIWLLLFGALSNGFGLIMRQEEALIGAVQFIVLPLTFLSSTFLATNLIPTWMQHVADFNPVNWAVVAGRTATSAHPDWGLAASRAGFLSALLVACLAFATNAFRSYQRSV
ncbi:MAG TPA: ABC transporter permease [Solirubrobacteraceae bacterium]|nr:ABC transporter permease [Solirubrobacteraceae bacterium]